MTAPLEVAPEGTAATPHTFPVLDTLRAVGALAVMTTHCAFQAGAYSGHGWLGVLLARLDFGVAIFFVLSGFLLSRSWFHAAHTGAPRPSLGTYYLKRAARVMPAFWVVAVLALTLMPDNADRGVGGWVLTLTLTDIYTTTPLAHGLTQAWSLATEVAFYLALPAIMWVILRPRRRGIDDRVVAATLLVFLIVSACWLAGSRSFGLPTTHTTEWLPGYLGWFGAGIALAWIFEARDRVGPVAAVRRRVVALAQHPGVCWTIAGSLLLIACTPLAGPTALVPATDAAAVTKNLLYLGAAALIVITGVWTNPRGAYAAVLSHRALRRFGLISYSFFLVHVALISAVIAVMDYDLFAGNFVQIWVLTFLSSWVASELLYRFVEEPSQRLVRRVT